MRFGAIFTSRLEAPDVIGERALRLDEFLRTLRIVDDSIDFATMAYNSLVLQELFDVGVIELRDAVEIEGPKGRPEVLALGQDCSPAQARLKTFEAEFFKKTKIVGNWKAPFDVMVMKKLRCGRAPAAARSPVMTKDSSAHQLPFQEHKPFIKPAWRDFVDLGAHHTLCHERILLNQSFKAFPINIVGKECPARVRLEAACKKKSSAIEASLDPTIVSLKELRGLRLVVGKYEKYDKHELSCFFSCDGMRKALAALCRVERFRSRQLITGRF
ncbi:hypothetical protein AGR5A_pb0139 [Agrobacterium genomosp. 5 str. CFBP 6626]|nr:hypothetical protein AGR5A_pb0139 [Agrobacterium genomosp. 5 str. CFBP 6626]